MSAEPTAPDPTFRHEAMATAFAITIAGREREYARQAAAAAWRELDRLESELSRYVESSDIARANRLARGETITIGEDAVQCLLQAAEISAATGRAFDPAYASVRAPDEGMDEPLFALDAGQHELTSLTQRLHLDLGAVGKGYALDVMARVLDDWDIDAALLESGGSTVLALEPPPGTPGWPVSLGEGDAQRLMHLTQRALSGSGVAVKGEHLINPRTGRPAPRHERAWSFALNGAVADALSTAFFVMADDEVALFCSTAGNVAAVLAAPDGSLAGYGALPPDWANTTSKTPGRRPR